MKHPGKRFLWYIGLLVVVGALGGSNGSMPLYVQMLDEA